MAESKEEEFSEEAPGASELYELLDDFFSYLRRENEPTPVTVIHAFQREPYEKHRAEASKARQTVTLQIVTLSESLGYELPEKDVAEIKNGGSIEASLKTIAELQKQLPPREETVNVEVIDPYE